MQRNTLWIVLCISVHVFAVFCFWFWARSLTTIVYMGHIKNVMTGARWNLTYSLSRNWVINVNIFSFTHCALVTHCFYTNSSNLLFLWAGSNETDISESYQSCNWLWLSERKPWVSFYFSVTLQQGWKLQAFYDLLSKTNAFPYAS